MARKTICRSSRFLLLGAALGAMAPAAPAQEAPRPASHTVRRGDTLWDLAARFLGDPFLWPQIFRLNTDVVEDPHWIYPGEVLKLMAPEGARAVPAEETPVPAAPAEQPAPGPERPAAREQAPAMAEYPMPEFARRRANQVSIALEAYVDRSYRPLRPGEFHSSGFLTEDQELPFGRMLGSVTPQQIRNLSDRSSATLFTQVAVRAPEGGRYAAGDSLLVVQLGDEFRGYGMAVVPTGLLRVTGEVDNQYLGEIVAVFGPIRNGQLVIPAERYSPGPPRRAEPVADGARGEVIGGREVRELKHPQNVVFISVGRRDGVVPGDVFEIRRRPGPRAGGPDAVDELMASGQVVRAGERTATLFLTHIVSPDIAPGTPAVQVAKLPAGAALR